MFQRTTCITFSNRVSYMYRLKRFGTYMILAQITKNLLNRLCRKPHRYPNKKLYCENNFEKKLFQFGNAADRKQSNRWNLAQCNLQTMHLSQSKKLFQFGSAADRKQSNRGNLAERNLQTMHLCQCQDRCAERSQWKNFHF